MQGMMVTPGLCSRVSGSKRLSTHFYCEMQEQNMFRNGREWKTGEQTVDSADFGFERALPIVTRTSEGAPDSRSSVA